MLRFIILITFFRYVELFGVDEPTDSVLELIAKIAIKNNWYHKVLNPSGEENKLAFLC